MRSIRLVLAASIPLVCQASFAQGWDYYSSAEDDFRIRAPGEFAISETEYPSEYGAVFPARVYSYESGGNRYSMTVVDYTDARAIHRARPNRTEADLDLYWEIDVRASVDYAATNLRKRGGTINYDAYHYIDRVEGHQLQITNDDGSRTYAAIYLHDSRLYILEATVGPRSPPPVMFQQSMEFLDEAGNRIRYSNFAEAIKVRDAEIVILDQ
jgi:hypothetical protein